MPYKNFCHSTENIFEKSIRIIKKNGLNNFFLKICQYIKLKFVNFFNKQLFYYYKIFKKNSSFELFGKCYFYFYHKYNTTYLNERAVEIPILKDMVSKYQGCKILEVGNVLSHYFSFKHEVIDKYEYGINVINEDITSFFTVYKYDLIVTISTLEHIGFDEAVKDPEKLLRAIGNMKDILNVGGKIIITAPLGYNKYFDDFIKKGEIVFDELFLLKRINRNNEWVQEPIEKIKSELFRYGFPYRNANWLVVGTIKKT